MHPNELNDSTSVYNHSIWLKILKQKLNISAMTNMVIIRVNIE